MIDPRQEALHTQTNTLLAAIATAYAGGSITGISFGSAVPVTGTYSTGDLVLNSVPTELGTVGAKYVITGWSCSAGGTPGTWLEQRAFTGN